VAVATIALAVVAALAWTLDSTASPTAACGGASAHTTLTTPTTGTPATTGADTCSQPATVDLLTPAGLRKALAAMRPVVAGTKVYQLTVYPTYAIAEIPTAANSHLYDEVDYRTDTPPAPPAAPPPRPGTRSTSPSTTGTPCSASA
jgi:hypothetical protein